MNLSTRLAGLVALAAAAPAAAQTQYWIHQFGTQWHDFAGALTGDGVGGVFVAGRTAGGPGTGVEWIARYDSAGKRLWTHEFSSTSSDSAQALTPDGLGGAFVAGATFGNLGGPNAGNFDAWIARYDNAGSRLWIRQFGAEGGENAQSLAPDGAGGAFVAGGVGYIGPFPTGDAWIARYDADGNHIWFRQFGTREEENAPAVASDGAGGMFVGGDTRGNFGGRHLGMYDAWLARFDGEGNQVWVRQFGTSGYEAVSALAVDDAGGTFAAGFTASSPGGPLDVWIAHFNPDGVQTWIHQFGGPLDDYAMVTPDGAGGAFFAGSTSASLGGPSAGDGDVWLARYDARGNRAWVRQFGTHGSDGARGLALAGVDEVFIAGYTMASLGGPHAGQFDGWIARYGPCNTDCNDDGLLTVADFGCFQTRFVAGDTYADCDRDGALTIADFGCFQSAFVAGCP